MKLEIEQKLKDVRWNNLDSKEVAAVARIESEISRGFISYCFENNFVLIDPPPITDITGSCENFLSVFDVDYFGKKGYLTQTGQLYLEAFLPEFSRVFCLGPSFRKEKAVDNRHAVAFNLLEIEVAHIDLEGLQNHIECIFDYMLENVLRRCLKELAMLGVKREWLETFRPPYQVITYKEAIKILNLKWGDDLKHKQELELVEKLGNKPIFVTHYPQEIKFFNMRVNRQNPKIVNSMDLLLPFSGEAVGAAEREEKEEILLERLNNSMMIKLMADTTGLAKEQLIKKFDWYVDLIKRYPVRHAGCGMGKNRITQSFLASTDIRSCSAYFLNKESLM